MTTCMSSASRVFLLTESTVAYSVSGVRWPFYWAARASQSVSTHLTYGCPLPPDPGVCHASVALLLLRTARPRCKAQLQVRSSL